MEASLRTQPPMVTRTPLLNKRQESRMPKEIDLAKYSSKQATSDKPVYAVRSGNIFYPRSFHQFVSYPVEARRWLKTMYYIN